MQGIKMIVPDMHPNVHSSAIDNSQYMEVT